MWPELVNGKRYWATALGRPRVGDHAVFKEPRDEGAYVKKVVAEEEGGFRVASLVPWGSSRDNFVLAPRENIIGKLL